MTEVFVVKSADGTSGRGQLSAASGVAERQSFPGFPEIPPSSGGFLYQLRFIFVRLYWISGFSTVRI